MKRSLSKQNSFSKDQIEALEAMTKALVHKVIHDPIMFIKNPDPGERKEGFTELLRSLFNLDEEFEKD